MKIRSCHSNHVVDDGRDRLRTAHKAEIGAAVVIEYAVEREATSVWDRLWLRQEINQEVTRHRNEISAPSSDALFLIATTSNR
jgi:hypothetical protein